MMTTAPKVEIKNKNIKKVTVFFNLITSKIIMSLISDIINISHLLVTWQVKKIIILLFFSISEGYVYYQREGAHELVNAGIKGHVQRKETRHQTEGIDQIFNVLMKEFE